MVIECLPCTKLDVNWISRHLKKEFDNKDESEGSFYYNIEHIKKSQRYLWIVTVRGKRAGFVLLSKGVDSPWVTASSSIMMLWILPSYRGQGVGRAVVEWHVQRNIGQGATMDQVNAIPNAVSFWERSGYKTDKIEYHSKEHVMRRDLFPTCIKRLRLTITPPIQDVTHFLQHYPDESFRDMVQKQHDLPQLETDGRTQSWKIHNTNVKSLVVLKGYLVMKVHHIFVESIQFTS